MRITGSRDSGTRCELKIQPVLPFAVSGNWNLIVRTIVSPIDQSDVSAEGRDQSGMGDVSTSFFFSPAAPGPGGMIWGAGPVFLWPTASDETPGFEK